MACLLPMVVVQSWWRVLGTEDGPGGPERRLEGHELTGAVVGGRLGVRSRDPADCNLSLCVDTNFII